MRAIYKGTSLWSQLLLASFTTGLFTSTISLPTLAQVTSDGTTNTTVNANGNDFTILNGINKGNNLFHSFSNFSVPTGGSATFDLTNTPNITTIFSRVTGGNVSNVDGVIRTLNSNNPVSLFLMNPNGIVFGPNASLNIGGSFVGTTASRIKFADGTEFSATDPAAPPLLTMSVPIGLQMGTTAGAIAVQGVPANNFLFRMPTLSMAPNQTLALIGGQVDINSANISAPDGHVELWAMQNGTVSIPPSGNWQLASSSPSPTWGTVTLRQSSYINTSGATGGAINIRGRGLTLQDGSNIESSTGANGQGQGINVQTTEFVDLLGVSHPDNYISPGLMTSITGSGAKAGNITVDTPRLRLDSGGWINSVNFGINLLTFAPINNAKTGDITVHAADVEISGYTPSISPLTGVNVASFITTVVMGGQQNESGAIAVEAERVRLIDGGHISTDLLGIFPPAYTIGKAGDISVTATQSLDILGTTPANFNSAIISSIQNLADGQGGNVTINTGQLTIAGGGTISSQVVGSQNAEIAGKGKAGNITIKATNVQVSNPVVDLFSQAPSGITVAVGQNATAQGGNINLTADSLRVFNGGQITSSSQGQGNAGSVNLQLKNLDVQGTSQNLINGSYLNSAIAASSGISFAAGSINITSDAVRVGDNAEITVSNTGSGDAGNLNITANNIFLDNGVSLRSEVKVGGQGNIHLDVNDVLLLRHGSKIITNALSTSTGGNININAGSIVAVPKENSDISANAVLGSGGNIQITTHGIFGLEFRDQLTDESDLTASSQFGVNGTVQVNTIGVDPNSGLVELPENFTDPSQKIASGCSVNTGSSFVTTGRGGIPRNPTQELRSDRPWSDTRDIFAFHTTKPAQAQIPKPPEILVQATYWRRNTQGKVELIADKSPAQVQIALTCAAALF
ncbi:MAG: S-layer family protein [Scytonema sp. PMC 1069.18]|nr:S-layer family protein [Scytonema sp. PMC 1069.18]MEC4885470.1 S-layer family protein [Scytonema sp. PMC 1070.18]